MLEAFILPGITLGLSAGVLPGALQAYLINTTLLYGWRRGLWVILSPLIVDGPLIIIVVFILGQLPDVALQVIRFLGGLLLLWIAWSAYQQYRAGVTLGGDVDESKRKEIPSPLSVLGKSCLMNLLSPGPYLFWTTVNGPLLIDALELSFLHAVAFMLAFYVTFLSMMSIVVFIFDRVGKMNDRIVRWALLFTIGLLLWFGTTLIAEAIGFAVFYAQIALVILIFGFFVYQKYRQQKV